jgi:hypothetical protein
MQTLRGRRGRGARHRDVDSMLGPVRPNSQPCLAGWSHAVAGSPYETVMVPFILSGWYSQCHPIPSVRLSVTVWLSPPSTS